MEAKHTATPWSFRRAKTLIHISSNARRIATIGSGHVQHVEDEANAEFIVRACNAHDDLVTALKSYLPADSIEDGDIGYARDAAARAALAKAGAA